MPSRNTPPGLRAALAIATATLTAAAVGGCGGDSSAANGNEDTINVVAAFYPLQFVTERVGGDAVTVTNLAQPGVEPHDLELSPRQVAEIDDARLVVYLSGFQPAVDDAVAGAGDAAFDVATVVPLIAGTGGHSHDEDEDHADEDDHADDEDGHEGEEGTDPHVWLDPTRLATIADELAGRLGAVDPDRAADFTANAAALRAELEQVDAAYASGLATCERREIVVSHAAFGYLADRYDLEQIAITGLSPESEPSPQRLAEVIEEAREHSATTIFFETLVSPRVAETIAREVGAQTAVLDPIEGLQPDASDDYLSLMQSNLDTLRPALGCS